MLLIMENHHLYVPSYCESSIEDTDYVYVIDGSTHSIVRTIPIGRNVHSMCTSLHPDGTLIYVANAGGFVIDTEETIYSTISVIDIITETVIHTISLGSITGLQYVTCTPQGDILYAIFHSNDILIIDLNEDTIIGKISIKSNQIIVGQDGLGYVPNSDGISIICPNKKMIIDTISVDLLKGVPRFLMIHPNGEDLYIYTNALSIYSLRTKEVIQTIRLTAQNMVISPNGEWLYLSNDKEGCIMVMDTTTHKIVNKMMTESDQLSMTVSSNGSWLYVIHSSTNSISCIDLTKHYVVNTTQSTPVSYSISNAYGICSCKISEKKKYQSKIKQNLDNVQSAFDWKTYVYNYPDLQRAGINTQEKAWNHWSTVGQKENRTDSKISTLFDWKTYIYNYPDLQRAGINTQQKAWNHWSTVGQKENRTDSNISTLFDWKTYVSNYSDLQRSGINTQEKAWNHWCTFGQKENRTYFK